MNTKSRVILEISAPALVGTILLFIWKHDEFSRTLGFSPSVFLVYLAFAYAFAIIPSLFYAWMMERWLKGKPLDSMRRLSAVGLSALLGLGAGYVISRASEAAVTWLGAIVGLLLGLILALTAKHEEKKA